MLDKKEIERRLKVIEQSKSISEASRKLGLDRRTVKDFIAKYGQKIIKLKEVVSQEILTHWEERKEDFWSIYEKFKNWTGHIFFLADLHIPYTQWHYVETALADAFMTDGKKMVILGGDNLDLEGFSRFYTEKKNIPLTEEGLPEDVNQYRRFMKVLEKIFDEIVIIRGNHDDRMLKLLLRTLTQEQVNYLKSFIDIEKHLLAVKSEKVTVSPYNYVFIGEAIFSHIEDYSVIKGRAGTWAIDYFIPRLKNLKVKGLMNGHTHRFSKLMHRGYVVVEAPALCKVMDYTRGPRFRQGKYEKWYFGYGYAYLEDGKIDINKFNPVYLGEEWLDE